MTPSLLREILIRTARNGNTRPAVEAAITAGATVITLDERFAATVRTQGARAVSVLRGCEAFRGTSGPYVVDLPVLGVVAEAWDRDLDRLRLALERLEEGAATIGRMRMAAEAAEAELVRLRAVEAQAVEVARRYWNGDEEARVVDAVPQLASLVGIRPAPIPAP